MSTEKLARGMRVTCDAEGCRASYERETFGRSEGWTTANPPGAEWEQDYCPDHGAQLESA